jgi:FkbM family methyltransferase
MNINPVKHSTLPAEATRAWHIVPFAGQHHAELEAAERAFAQAVRSASGPVPLAPWLAPSSALHRSAYIVDTVQRATRVACGDAPATFRAQGQVSALRADAVFMCAGVGEQYLGMAEGLYASAPQFRAELDACDEILRRQHGLELLTLLYPAGRPVRATEVDSTVTPLDLRALMGASASGEAHILSATRIGIAHPALFAIEYALAKWWMANGIQPAAMIGHSLGEYVVACLCGVMSLADALRAVVARAALIERIESGAMLAVALSPEQLAPLLPARVSLSAINASKLCVVAGPAAPLDELRARLAARGIAHRAVHASHAFHSSLMQAISKDIEQLFTTIPLHAPHTPYISNLTGTWITAEQATSARYWARHSCETVRFADGIDTLRRSHFQHYIEIGVGHALVSFVREQCRDDEHPALVVQSLPGAHERLPDEFVVARAQAELWCAGIASSWDHAAMLTSGDCASLPPAAPLPQSDQRPMDELEALLATLWCDNLGVERVDRHDHYFRLGGNSLQALKLAGRIRDELAVPFNVRVLFQFPVFTQFVVAVEHALAAALDDDAPPLMAANAELDREATAITLPNGLTVHQFNPEETKHFYHDIFDGKVYERNGIVIGADDVIFDVGANVGLFSLYASGRGERTQLYAFEPAPPVFALLQKNLASLGARAQLFNVGVSDQAGQLELTYYPLSTGMSSFHADVADEQAVLGAIIANQFAQSELGGAEATTATEELLELRFTKRHFTCAIRTLSDVIDEHGVERIDLLKIDVQKSEAAVLNGIAARHWPRIRQVVVETHDIDGRIDAICALLRKQGFTVSWQQDALYRGSNIYNLYAKRDSLAATSE